MKTKLIFSLLLFIVFNKVIYSQNESGEYFGFYVDMGYSGFALNEIKNNYTEQAQSFINYYNVPVITQKKYPANGIYGGSFFYNTSDYRIKVGFLYASTKAYSLYGDIAGELDLIGSIKSYIYYAGVSRVITDRYFLKPYVEVCAGYISGNYDLERIVRRPPYAADKEKTEVSGGGVYFEPALGALYQFSFFDAYIKGGYRYAIVETLSGDVQIPYARFQISDAQVNMDMSGFFIMSGLSFTLN